jgi:hypothetical protein
MKPTISTSPFSESCAIAGINPCIFSKSISSAICLSPNDLFQAKTKSPLHVNRASGPDLVIAE